jgi:hypothetical protein
VAVVADGLDVVGAPGRAVDIYLPDFKCQDAAFRGTCRSRIEREQAAVQCGSCTPMHPRPIGPSPAV